MVEQGSMSQQDLEWFRNRVRCPFLRQYPFLAHELRLRSTEMAMSTEEIQARDIWIKKQPLTSAEKTGVALDIQTTLADTDFDWLTFCFNDEIDLAFPLDLQWPETNAEISHWIESYLLPLFLSDPKSLTEEKVE
jgi:hypothetical protein